jgi:hypothetical protein
MKRPNLSSHGRGGKTRNRSKSNYAESLELPHRWRTILGGFLIVLGVRVFCSDPVGNLKVPTLGDYFYIAPVMIVAFFLLYLDWKRKTGRH